MKLTGEAKNETIEERCKKKKKKRERKRRKKNPPNNTVNCGWIHRASWGYRGRKEAQGRGRATIRGISASSRIIGEAEEYE